MPSWDQKYNLFLVKFFFLYEICGNIIKINWDYPYLSKIPILFIYFFHTELKTKAFLNNFESVLGPRDEISSYNYSDTTLKRWGNVFGVHKNHLSNNSRLVIILSGNAITMWVDPLVLTLFTPDDPLVFVGTYPEFVWKCKLISCWYLFFAFVGS